MDEYGLLMVRLWNKACEGELVSPIVLNPHLNCNGLYFVMGINWSVYCDNII